MANGETIETVRDFILGGSKITADGDCSHKLKRRLLLGRKVMANLDSKPRKQRHYFVNKGLSSQSLGFSNSHVWMWELDYKESWVLKNWCFWTVVLEKTLKSPLDCKEIESVNLKGNSPEYSLEGLRISWSSNTLATWCQELTHLKRSWSWETLKTGGEGDDREWDGGWPSPTRKTWVWASSGSWWWIGKPGILQSMGSRRVGHNWATELNWNGELFQLSRPYSLCYNYPALPL